MSAEDAARRWKFAERKGAPSFESLLLLDGDGFSEHTDTHYCEIERSGDQYTVRFSREWDGG